MTTRIWRIGTGLILVAASVAVPIVGFLFTASRLPPRLGALGWPMAIGAGCCLIAFVAPLLGAGVVLIDPRLAEHPRERRIRGLNNRPHDRHSKRSRPGPELDRLAGEHRSGRRPTGAPPSMRAPKLSGRHGYHAATLVAVVAGGVVAVVLTLALVPRP